MTTAATMATARANERVDSLCARVLGTTQGGVVQAMLELNPGLAALGPWLPMGTQVIMPDVPTATPNTLETVTLW